MMTLLPPTQLLRDQFSYPPIEVGDSRRPAWPQLVAVAPPLAVAGLVVGFHVRIMNAGPLLTATSIMTGFIFTLSLRFWERSLDARSDVSLAFDAQRLILLDRMRSHLVWTVLVGVLSTGSFAICTFFVQSKTGMPVAITALLGFLVLYQLTLVLASLFLFYDAAYSLR